MTAKEALISLMQGNMRFLSDSTSNAVNITQQERRALAAGQ